MQVILGIDTSCYTTSLAAVDDKGMAAASCRRMLPVAQGQRGLRQSEAVFAHVRQLPELMANLRRELPQMKIEGICASEKPRDGEDSYMPVFMAGASLGRSLAAALSVPYLGTTHQRGHLAAAAGTSFTASEYLALHLSGGTTDLLHCTGDAIATIGGSRDIHAGQLVDRIGVAMGLPFPAGPALEEDARGKQPLGLLPASVKGLWCNLSGAETKALSLLREGTADVSIEVYDFLARTIARLIEEGCRETGISKVLATGGVASSALFRELLLRRLEKRRCSAEVFFGRPEHSGDNALGVARIGWEAFATRKA